MHHEMNRMFAKLALLSLVHYLSTIEAAGGIAMEGAGAMREGWAAQYTDCEVGPYDWQFYPGNATACLQLAFDLRLREWGGGQRKCPLEPRSSTSPSQRRGRQ